MTVLLPDTRVPVCRYDDLLPELGVRALVGDAHVAVFRTADGDVYAIDAVDPFSGASVLSRGVVGTHRDAPVVVSPMHKQRFDLRTGRCVDDPSARVRVYAVDVVDGRVVVGTDTGADAEADADAGAVSTGL
jgi:nitrite reductase (NADH) small subunit